MVDHIVEVKCEAIYPEINANIRECAKSSGEALQYAMQAGALLVKLKDMLPHGAFQQAVEDRCDCSYDTARVYMKIANELPAIIKAKGKSLDKTQLTIRGAEKLISINAPPKQKTDAPVFSPPAGGKQSSAPRSAAPTTQAETRKPSLDAVVNASTSTPATGSAALSDDPIGDACEHERDEEGDACRKCRAPMEPVNMDSDPDDGGRLTTQRAKTVKTVEALMRAFDDLNEMLARPAHKPAIAGCKTLLQTAREWK